MNRNEKTTASNYLYATYLKNMISCAIPTPLPKQNGSLFLCFSIRGRSSPKKDPAVQPVGPEPIVINGVTSVIYNP